MKYQPPPGNQHWCVWIKGNKGSRVVVSAHTAFDAATSAGFSGKGFMDLEVCLKKEFKNPTEDAPQKPMEAATTPRQKH